MNYPKYYEVTYKDGSPTGYITEEKLNRGTFRNENAHRIKSIKSVLPYVVDGENRNVNEVYKRLTGYNDAQMQMILSSIPVQKVETIAPKDLKVEKHPVHEQEARLNAGNTGTSKRGPKPKLKPAV